MTASEKRPRLWWFLVLTVLVQGGLYLAYSYRYLKALQEWSFALPMGRALDADNARTLVTLWLLASTWVLLGLASFVIGVGLRGRQRWAWAAAMVVEGVILVLALEAYLIQQANTLHYGAMALAVIIVLMLNRREMQVFYRTSHEREELEAEPEPEAVE